MKKWRHKNKERLNSEARLKSERLAWKRKQAAGLNALGIDAGCGVSVLTWRQIKQPRLLWLDQHGRLHREEELSAEELIHRWQQQHKGDPT
jgi:hypothetical protein